MCAINGFTYRDEDLLRRMNTVTKHRGPDADGIFLDPQISLGHNRLAIIDTSEAGHQPMKNTDGSIIISYNGELYNYRELRDVLKDEYRFVSESDTEVILAAYDKWGTDCFKKFNGMFALAIWDARKMQLVLARDQVGIKPLYYHYNGRNLIFSSEIKAILEHDVSRELDRDAFSHYLRILYVPEPHTMLKGIRKMPPAHYMVFRENAFTLERYWGLGDSSPATDSYSDLKNGVRTHVLRAVEEQLVSDRPLGVYLSGGIDSSIVLQAASSIRNQMDTFSVGFELANPADTKKFNADFEIAKKTAAHYGSKHHEVLIKPDMVQAELERVVWHMDEPISNPTAISMSVLARFAKEQVAVTLGGDGGDELFGGYERYRLALAAERYQYLPEQVRKALANISKKASKLNTPPGMAMFAQLMFQKNPIVEKVVSSEVINLDVSRSFFAERFFTGNLTTGTEALMSTDLQSWLPDQSLVLSDKMSMAHGLEVRVPLLSIPLVEYAQTIPLHYKVRLFETKKILREAFRHELPDWLFKQPKRGWFSPGAKWLRDADMAQFTDSVLSPDYYAETASLFNWEAIHDIVVGHREQSAYNLTIIWALLTFQLWARRYQVRVV